MKRAKKMNWPEVKSVINPCCLQMLISAFQSRNTQIKDGVNWARSPDYRYVIVVGCPDACPCDWLAIYASHWTVHSHWAPRPMTAGMASNSPYDAENNYKTENE